MFSAVSSPSPRTPVGIFDALSPIARRNEVLQTYNLLIKCKMQEGESVRGHLMKMKGCIERLALLGSPLREDLASHTIVSSLSSSFRDFAESYADYGMDDNVAEVCESLISIERRMDRPPLAILPI